MEPVGLASALLGRALGAGPIVAADVATERLQMAESMGLVDHAVPADEQATATIRELTDGRGCEAGIDCAGSGAARTVTLGNTRTWGRCAFVGEGGQISFPVSELLIHKQITLHGSWVTSLRHMEELLEHLVRWNLHPERIVTHRFTLDQADEAHHVGDRGAAHRASPWEVGSVRRIAPQAQPAHR